jgi:hypothetical protein
MAEELDAQKPKVELIKRAKDPESQDEGAKSVSVPDHGGRRKVIVVKKKPSGGIDVPKKVQPKAVAAEAPKEEAPGEAIPPSKEKPVKEPERQVSSLAAPQRPAAAAGRVGGRPVGPRPPRNEPPFAQRPVGAAGRVGGRPVGGGEGRPGNRPNNGGFGGGPSRFSRPGGRPPAGGFGGFLPGDPVRVVPAAVPPPAAPAGPLRRLLWPKERGR